MKRLADTQREAWDAVQGKLPFHRGAVLAVVRSRRRITLQGLCDVLGWRINRVSGRVTELAAQGLIRDSGDRFVNPESGRRVIVWEAVSVDPEQLGLFGRVA